MKIVLAIFAAVTLSGCVVKFTTDGKTKTLEGAFTPSAQDIERAGEWLGISDGKETHALRR